MRQLAYSALLSMAACSRGEPPTYSAPGFSESVAPIPQGIVDASAPDVADAAQPEDSGALPQTHDRPKPEGELFEARVAGLWDAIVHDDPDRGLPFFFPLAAYVQVKAISNPTSDFKHRLVANFVRDVHAAHEKLGAHAADAKLIGMSVPMNQARWVEPNEEGNKLGYFRVYGSKLQYSVGNKQLAIDVTSLISWRGEWYVVHLSGFK
jgi:hypothetical protein